MYRVVIVDDEPFMLEGMRLMIDWGACGFELVGEAGSAQEALHLIDTLRPHLLITDVRMPGMLGTDLAAIVHNYHPDTIVLFYSGYRDFAYAQSAIRAQAFGYLIKPIDADEVHDTLAKVKAELDKRGGATSERLPVVRDHVLRRIAMGDDSAESLMRAGVLLELKRDDPCYCAVLRCEGGTVTENAMLLLTACGATPFLLTSAECGLSFRQIERDLHMLARLRQALAAEASFRVSVGDVHRGPEGFRQSLREAMDAQGTLFEPRGDLRLYRPLDDQTALWIASVGAVKLREALQGGDQDALEECLRALRESVASEPPGAFALRYLAASLDPGFERGGDSPLRPYWENEPTSSAAWLDGFSEALRSVHGEREQCSDKPAPVDAALAIIRERYATQLSMNSVAEELHMNPAYLGQLIKRNTGHTLHQLLLETRIERACVLLRQTSRTVGEIASEVGFRDVDYFSQKFRGQTGMSPLAYRGRETDS